MDGQSYEALDQSVASTEPDQIELSETNKKDRDKVAVPSVDSSQASQQQQEQLAEEESRREEARKKNAFEKKKKIYRRILWFYYAVLFLSCATTIGILAKSRMRSYEIAERPDGRYAQNFYQSYSKGLSNVVKEQIRLHANLAYDFTRALISEIQVFDDPYYDCES